LTNPALPTDEGDHLMSYATSEPTERTAEFVTGLFALAGWMTHHKLTPPRIGTTIVHPLHTNAAVEEFAARTGLTVDYDEHGNASATAAFGPVEFNAYGYLDYEADRRRVEEGAAREYAAKHGLALVPADQATAAPAAGL
jgi:hypothetical protein